MTLEPWDHVCGCDFPRGWKGFLCVRCGYGYVTNTQINFSVIDESAKIVINVIVIYNCNKEDSVKHNLEMSEDDRGYAYFT